MNFCTSCGAVLNETNCYPSNKNLKGKCKHCCNKYWAERQLKRKMLVLNHYSNGKMECARCQEKRLEFLTIDHMKNDGAKHRKELKEKFKHVFFYKWLIENNYPEGYQVLCRECNLDKWINGE